MVSSTFTLDWCHYTSFDHLMDMGVCEPLMKAEKASKLSQRKDWYKILGVSKSASIAKIKRAYKKLALLWHPHKNVGNREPAENKFRDIAAAYEANTLSVSTNDPVSESKSSSVI